jgi:ABC-type transport system involved in multi-copper enzyme maturation permease subunit
MKLLKIEWLKLSGHPFFWVGMGLYFLLIFILLFTLGEFSFMQGQEEGGAALFNNLKDAGVYDMPVLWHDITYIPTFLKFIPVFLLIFFVSSEYSYRTARQNVIDGLSKGQLFISKILTAFFISFLCTLSIFLFGTILAFMHNDNLGVADLFIGSDYLLAYFMELFFMMAFALFATIFLKRSAIVVIVILLYYVIEGVATLILQAYFPEGISNYLPTQPSRELNLQPFTRLFQVNGMSMDDLLSLDSPDQVSRKFMIITFVYTLAFFAGGYFIFKRKNL